MLQADDVLPKDIAGIRAMGYDKVGCSVVLGEEFQLCECVDDRPRFPGVLELERPVRGVAGICWKENEGGRQQTQVGRAYLRCLNPRGRS